jgi:lysophospholipase L1-like esterase
MRSSLLLFVCFVTHALASVLSKRLPQKFAYAAFGDSFSAGIGAGLFYDGSPDGRDNICARMTKSYPAQLNSVLGEYISSFNFISCSGDVIADIDGQVQVLGNQMIDVATLSISGNDFNFANVVVSALDSGPPMCSWQ